MSYDSMCLMSYQNGKFEYWVCCTYFVFLYSSLQPFILSQYFLIIIFIYFIYLLIYLLMLVVHHTGFTTGTVLLRLRPSRKIIWHFRSNISIAQVWVFCWSLEHNLMINLAFTVLQLSHFLSICYLFMIFNIFGFSLCCKLAIWPVVSQPI